MDTKPGGTRLTKEAEDDLFQRLLQRFNEAGAFVTSGADAVGALAGRAADGIAEYVNEALGAIGLGVAALDDATKALAKYVVDSRRASSEPVAQVIFRVPESLRDDVKRLALDEKRQMEELLTEATIDLLLKYHRPVKLIEDMRTRGQATRASSTIE